MASLNITKHNDYIVLELNRPEAHHALNDDLITALHNACDEITNNDQWQFCILKSSGKTFCAGADIKWMQAGQSKSQQINLAEAQYFSELFIKLWRLPIPLITIVQGAAYGGGLGLIACSDVVIAADNAEFCFSEVKLGLIPAMISPYVIHAIGLRQAKRYFLTAERFNDFTAKQIGLVHEVIATIDLERHVKELIDHCRNNQACAVRQCKAFLDEWFSLPISPELTHKAAEVFAYLRHNIKASV